MDTGTGTLTSGSCPGMAPSPVPGLAPEQRATLAFLAWELGLDLGKLTMEEAAYPHMCLSPVRGLSRERIPSWTGTDPFINAYNVLYEEKMYFPMVYSPFFFCSAYESMVLAFFRQFVPRYVSVIEYNCTSILFQSRKESAHFMYVEFPNDPDTGEIDALGEAFGTPELQRIFDHYNQLNKLCKKRLSGPGKDTEQWCTIIGQGTVESPFAVAPISAQNSMRAFERTMRRTCLSMRNVLGGAV